MSLEYRDVSAAAQRFSSQLKTVAGTRGLVPLTILAAVSIAGAARGLIYSTASVRVSPPGLSRSARFGDPIVRASTRRGPSAELALSEPAAARAARDRWQAAARRVCEERQHRDGAAAATPYSICVREALRARWYEDSVL
jgi:hypothetical protein